MRKFNIFAISSAVLLLSAVSCTSDSFLENKGSFISMNLVSKSLETKAEMQGEDPLNENVINSVYYFFYKDGEETSAPVVKGRLKGLEHKSGVRTEEIPVASGISATLFESSDECQAFIVANPPQGLETFLVGSPTLEQLRAKLFQSSLDGIQDHFTMIFDAKAAKTADTGNIMTVEANLRRLANKFTVSLKINDKVSGETEWTSVPASAKVEFHNAFKETALGGDFATVKALDSNFEDRYFNTAPIEFGTPVQEGEIWKSRVARPMYTYSMSWDFSASHEPYLLIELPWRNAVSGDVQLTYYKVLFNAKELSINNWCHLTVELDRLGGFYKDEPIQIFDNMEYLVLDWNDAYEDDGLVTDINDARYLMMNQTEYWIYDQDTWDLPYITSHECEIVLETYERPNYRKRLAETISGNSREMGTDSDGNPIYDCTLNGSVITFHHKMNNDFTSTETIDGIDYGTYDAVPYTFKLTIRHKDNHDYKEEVIVHQYPAVYIEAQPNSAGVKLNPGTDQLSTSYIQIIPELEKEHYGQDPNDYNILYLYYGYGYDPQENAEKGTNIGNSNGNMYVITTTVAPVIDGQEYMLADPRQFTKIDEDWKKDYNEQGEVIFPSGLTIRPSNPGDPGYPLSEEVSDIFEEAPALYGGSPRTLEYYYPTKDTKEAENIIAPKLRVASSWGQTRMLSYDKALRRCAAYQEDGYPAGRWRMPTKAEVMYICKLSSDHVIPQLFGQFSDAPDVIADYWCSTGKVGVYKVEEADGTLLNAYAKPVYTDEISREFMTEKTVAVRCVYDEWYWENRDYDNGTVKTTKGRLPESLWRTPYWGDMPR